MFQTALIKCQLDINDCGTRLNEAALSLSTDRPWLVDVIQLGLPGTRRRRRSASRQTTGTPHVKVCYQSWPAPEKAEQAKGN